MADEKDLRLFVDRRQTDSIKWSKYAGTDIIPLWIADMDFPSPKAVVDAICRRARHGVFGYGTPPQSLFHVFAKRMEKLYNWTIEPEWIIWLPGLVSGINLACRAVGNPGDTVLTTIPVYPPFLSAPGYSQRKLKTVKMHIDSGRWRIDFDRLEKAVTSDTKLFLLCSPHNPTGRVFTYDELSTLARICLEHDLVICSDEIHCDLILKPGCRHIPTACLGRDIARRTITLMAPSKTFNIPGLGCSMAIIPDPEIRKKFKAAKAGIVPDVNIMGFVAAEAALRDDSPWLAKILDYLRSNMELVLSRINAAKVVSMLPVEGTYLAWIDVRSTGLEDPAAFFEKAGVALSDGGNFGTPGFVRLNFGCHRDLLQKALERIERALKRLELGQAPAGYRCQAVDNRF